MPAYNTDQQQQPPPASSSFFSYPVKYAVNSALRRLSSDPFSTRSRSRSRQRDNSRSPSRLSQPPAPPPPKQELNLIDLDDDPTFGDFESAPETGSESSSQLPQIQQPHSQPQNNHSAFSFPSLSLSQTSYTPSPRHTPPPAPFQPPPLTPLTLDNIPSSLSSDSLVLTRLLAEEIRLLLPPRLQLLSSWNLIFSLEHDGSSLATLYQNCFPYSGQRGGFVLVVRDSSGGIFGSYLSDPPHPSKGHYYGNGECFLWRSSILKPGILGLGALNLPPPPSEDTTNAQRMTTVGSPKAKTSFGDDALRPPSNGINGLNDSNGNGHASGVSTPETIRFKAFPYSGINDYMIFCEAGFLSVGGGDGHYGLWLDSSLERGVSDKCPTFGNEPLSDEGGKFDIIGVEVWYLGS